MGDKKQDYHLEWPNVMFDTKSQHSSKVFLLIVLVTLNEKT